MFHQQEQPCIVSRISETIETHSCCELPVGPLQVLLSLSMLSRLMGECKVSVGVNVSVSGGLLLSY